ncbi:MAG: NAD(P)H-hydrate dehydratase [Phycisphaerales bacterium]|nr:NAD(P)H-hydrate dehydratase [Phycisphaerales bacterium]
MTQPDATSGEFAVLPERSERGHKGTFGTVVVVGGTAFGTGGSLMVGAPALTGTAALRAGAGLAKLVLPAVIAPAAVAIAPSCTALTFACDQRGAYEPSDAVAVLDRAIEGGAVLAIGPGLGMGDGPTALVMRAITQHESHAVLDADALNVLSVIPEFHQDFQVSAVLTPHVGECRTLMKALRIEVDLTGTQGLCSAATALAQRLGCVVVLKSATTVVADAIRCWVHDEPNPVLGTAGTGDVLTGTIAGLIAQFVPPSSVSALAGIKRAQGEGRHTLSLFDAARLGVIAHARAAKFWRERHNNASGGMLAMELAGLIPEALQSMRG